MQRRPPVFFLIITLALMTGCASYTARDAMPTLAIPTTDRSELPVTKHSLIIAEQEAIAAEQQAIAAEAEEASLQETVDTLQATIEELEQAIAAYEQDDTIQQLQGELDTRRQLIEEGRAAITGLDAEIEALSDERTELADQLASADAALDLQQQREAELQRLLEEKEERISELQGEIENLLTEQRNLSAQLQGANAVLDEQRRSEAAAEAERIRSEERRLTAERQEAERLEREAEAERARLEEERELARLIPPLSQLTLPHRYVVSDTVQTLPKGSTLKTLFLPLSDVPWKSSDLVDSVALSIGDLDVPVIFVTGAMENVTALVRRLAVNAILLEGGAVITPLEVLETTTHSVRVRVNGEQTLRLSLANLVDYAVLTAFLDGEGSWKEAQQRISGPRLKTLLSIAREGLVVEPTILAGSLYEPSHQDWSTFSPVAYRQVDYLWPLTAALDEEQFLDVYRLTHFSADTDSGNTVAVGSIKERIDYLFSRKILPLSSTIIPIGGESTPREGEVRRWGIAASLLIP